MTSTTHFKQMTNTNNTVTTVAKESGLKQAASYVAFALAPFAVVLGIATATEVITPQSANAGGCYHSTGFTAPDWTSGAVGQTMYGETIWFTCN